MKLFFRASAVAVAVLAVSSSAFAGHSSVAQGTVKAVSEKAVTLVDEDGAETTFEVSPGAKVYAEGAGRKYRMLRSSGRATTMGDFVREGHYVTVHFLESSGARRVTALRVHGRTAQS